MRKSDRPLLAVGDGHTELTDQDRQGLLPTYITTRGELNDAEQRNIAKAQLRRAPRTVRLLDDKYLRDLHKAMFDEVWAWAGTYRRFETNIGIDPNAIPTAVRDLVNDTLAWIEFATFDHDELAIRFHHRLVFTHPFPNGNGRHGRIAADYLIRSLGGRRFSWGAGDADTTDIRLEYQRALQRADAGDITDLLAFARS